MRPPDRLVRESPAACASLPAQTWREEEAVHQLRGLDQFRQRAALAVGQRRDIGADLGRRETAAIVGQLTSDGMGSAVWTRSFTGSSPAGATKSRRPE